MHSHPVVSMIHNATTPLAGDGYFAGKIHALPAPAAAAFRQVPLPRPRGLHAGECRTRHRRSARADPAAGCRARAVLPARRDLASESSLSCTVAKIRRFGEGGGARRPPGGPAPRWKRRRPRPDEGTPPRRLTRPVKPIVLRLTTHESEKNFASESSGVKHARPVQNNEKNALT